MDKNIKVFVVIVTYNGRTWIEKCLNSLKASSTPIEIIVIDNGSNDGTQEIIKQYTEIDFIQSEENLGFGKANNKGIQIAINKEADYIFLLNQDAWIETNTITVLLEVAKRNPGYGVISPVHLNGNYTGMDFNFSKQLAPDTCPSFYSDLYVQNLKPLYEIKFVNAAAWLISASCIKKIGLFEPMFFLYGEDNNFLQRVEYHSLKAGVTPLCTICHDREIRQGNFNEKGIKIWERTFSLILLLNIGDSYAKSIVLFLKERILAILKNIFQKKFSALKHQFNELLFLVRNYRKLKKIRASYKWQGNGK
ncbi:glycosyltransferase family 2 protein [soil metagenome]